jgi:catechol 2,3-dioxygenase-like lactoylglutathione lyase family enzyme
VVNIICTPQSHHASWAAPETAEDGPIGQGGFATLAFIANAFSWDYPRGQWCNGSKAAMIEGLSHLTFIVSDLDKMENMLTTVLDAEKVYDSGNKIFSLSKERFFLIGGLWVAIMEGEGLTRQTYNHVAFKMGADDYDDRLARIKSLGLEVREGRARVEGEGHSIYFHDYDNHLFELHSGTLDARLKRHLA